MEQKGGLAPFLTSDSQIVQVDLNANVDLDVDQFTQLLAEVAAHGHEAILSCSPCQQRLEQAVTLYGGDFLEGYYLPDGNEFESWVLARREAFRRQLLEGLENLSAVYLAEAELKRAEATARRLIAIDPLRESGHRQLMTTLATMGQRAAAVSQYETLKSLLDEELGAEPSAATIRLYEAIVDGNVILEDVGKTTAILPVSGDERKKDGRETGLTVPHNLPAQPTPFIGRQEELEQLTAYLSDSKTRLITISGAGGMGKTRLAIAVAEQLVGEQPGHALFPDGVYFVSLAPLTSANHIVKAITTAFDKNLSFSGDIEQLLDFLRPKRLLLILDNFEHLLDGAVIVARIIQSAPGVQVMVTSRERLQLRGEQLFPIEGLDVPESALSEGLMEYTAVALLLQSARRVQPNFSPGKSELMVLVDICRRLEGMPLGIELAAAWVDSLPLSDILAELESSIDLLEIEMRDMPARHRSLRGMYEASWLRLSKREQSVLGRLCPFRGGFTRQAAEEVAGATLPILSLLVSKSLLQFQPAEQRYRVHQLLRQYSAQKMSTIDQLEAAHDAHSQYYLNFVRAREEAMQGRGQQAALAEISGEFENIRAAWLWAAKREDYESIGQVVHALLWGYCDRMWSFYEGIELRQQALTLLSPQTGQDPHRIWYRLLTRHLIPREKEIPELEKALSFFQEEEDLAEIVLATGQLGWAKVRTGDSESGLPLMEETVRLSRELDDKDFAEWLCQLGIVYSIAGLWEKAEAAFEEGLPLYRQFHDRADMIKGLKWYGGFQRQIGRFSESEATKHEVIILSKEFGEQMVAVNQLDLALASFFRGDFEATEHLIRQAVPIVKPALTVADFPYNAGDFELGLIALLHSHYERAEQLLMRFNEVAAGSERAFEAAWGLSLSAFCLKKHDVARQQLRTAVELVITLRSKGYAALILPVIALLYNKLGKREQAVELLALGHKHLPQATGWLEKWSLFVQLQADMETDLGPSAFTFAWERGQNLNLWSTTKQLKQELAAGEW
jgi:predicted ATPase/DNA-binding SARP family transcriptional activator